VAKTYISINLSATGGTGDRKVKVSTDDTTPGFLEDKIVVGSTKVTKQTLDPGANETLEIDVDDTQIDHNVLTNYDIDEHRTLDDASTTATSLWSSTKIQTELDGKINAATPMTDNKIVKSVGTSGIDVEATGIDVDDLNNVTGINDLTIDGDLTVNGTTTTVSSTTLDVTDANITVNDGGTQASADAADAGLTVEMSDATDAIIGYDSTTTSKFKIGEVGSTHEVVTTNHAQTVINKTINVDNNTLSNVETDNLKAGVLSTDLSLAVDNTKLAGAQAIKDYVASQIATKDDASEITYTPSVLTDWDGDADPGNVDAALDQLAERVDDNEGAITTNATNLSNHVADAVDAHDASAISNVPAGNLTATDVQSALDELQSDIDTRATGTELSDHIGDPTDAHAASAITNTPAGNIAATTVQAAIDELDSEKYNAADFDGDFDTRLATKTTTDLTEGTNLYFTDARAHVAAGDIAENSFAIAESATNAAVTGLAFANGTVRSFKADISVEIDATADLYEKFEIEGIQKGADWEISISSVGDDALIDFDITAAGQVTYSSTTYAGFVSGAIKFRASTTSV
jgi:hypothetical protein